MSTTDELARAIRGRRKTLGISQTELADLAGVSVRVVSSVENGKPTARLDTILPLLDVLGLDLTIRVRTTT